MIIPSPRPSLLLETIEQARRDGVIDREMARAMRHCTAPRCAHSVPTIVLRQGEPCCARCWAEQAQSES